MKVGSKLKGRRGRGGLYILSWEKAGLDRLGLKNKINFKEKAIFTGELFVGELSLDELSVGRIVRGRIVRRLIVSGRIVL